MSIGDQMKGKEPGPMDDKFPDGMRVLVVDDDPVCLKILEGFLCFCKYKPTMVMNGRMALDMLRGGGQDKFDMVITDVHMPDMDGFKLLDLIGLEMDLPVIMLSVDGERETILKGITHGACEYLVKPVQIEDLKNIWQHVVRKKTSVVEHISSDQDDAYHRVQPGIAEDGHSGAKSKKCSKNKKNDGDHSNENKERMAGVANRKKPRVAWSGELHRKFVEVVEHLGIDRADPKKILEIMNVDYLTRESVASHLQKYRHYLKRVTDENKSNPLGDSSERRNLSPYVNMYHQGSSSNYHEQQRGQPSSAFAFGGSNTPFAAPSVLGADGVSVQSRNWAMGTVGHGGSMPRHAAPWLHDSRRPHASGPPINSFPKTPDNIMLDAFPPSNPGKDYASVLRQKMLQASNVAPSSHPGRSFVGMLTINPEMFDNRSGQFQVQPPEQVRQYYGLMNMAPSAVSAYHDTQFPCLVGSSSNPWQNVASSSSLAYMNGTPLAPSQVNISQLPSFAASTGHIYPMIQNEEQNQMEGIINTDTGPVAGFTEQTAPINMASNTAPFELTNGNILHMTHMVNGGSTTSALPNLQADGSFVLTQMPTQTVNGGSISSALPELHADSSVTPTQMVNGGENASATLPMQEGAVDLRALDDQPIYSDPFFVDDTYANMLNQDLTDDAFFSGGC